MFCLVFWHYTSNSIPEVTLLQRRRKPSLDKRKTIENAFCNAYNLEHENVIENFPQKKNLQFNDGRASSYQQRLLCTPFDILIISNYLEEIFQ